jgi:hypothetical protein
MTNDVLSSLQPEATASLMQMTQSAWQATDPELLGLCRCLIVAMLEGKPPRPLTDPAVPGLAADKVAALDDWVTAEVFSPIERAALAYTEQFVISVSAVSEEQVESLRTHLGDEKTYAFAAAVYVVEMTERLRIVAGVVLGNGSSS